MKLDTNTRRKNRNRKRVKNDANGKPRLSIHRTACHIYAQVIDDVNGKTLAHAASSEAAIKKALKNTGNAEAAKKIGEEIGKRALAKNVVEVVFDRGAFRYHGRVKALAEAARTAGLKF